MVDLPRDDGAARLVVREYDGQAVIQLRIRDVTVGSARVPWHVYRDMTRRALLSLMSEARDSIRRNIEQVIWSHAQSTLGDGERAKEALEKLGLGPSVLDAFADALARGLAQAMASKIPEHQ